MKVIIADDEERAREILRHFLGKVPDVEVIGEAATGVEAVTLARQYPPDAVFLDIRMPDMTGVEAARLIAETNPSSRLVFVTAFEEYAIPAFDLEAVDYLVKPLNASRVLQAVERVRRRLTSASSTPVPQPAATPTSTTPVPPQAATTAAHAQLERLALETTTGSARRTVFLNIRQVLVLEAAGKHTRVMTTTAQYTVAEGLTELSARLPANLFLRVHRGYVVNLSAVRELFTDGRTFAAHVDGISTPVPVSRDRVTSLKESLGLAEA